MLLILMMYLSIFFSDRVRAVSIRGRRTQITQAHTEGNQNPPSSIQQPTYTFPELNKNANLGIIKGRRTIRKARTYNLEEGTKSSFDTQTSKIENAFIRSLKSDDSNTIDVGERRRSNYRAFYNRKKAKKERGDKGAMAWFKLKTKRFVKVETDLTRRMQTNNYTKTDLERYNKRIARQARYRARKKRSKIDLNKVPSDRSSRKGVEEWTKADAE
jgi:hypothetical protein